MNWIHVPAGIPRGVKPKTRQWWLDFEEPIDLHDSGDTGVALLSRLPLSDVKRIDLPWQECPWRPRLAMAATVSVGITKLRILNAHVDPHAAVGGQLEQLEALVAEADERKWSDAYSGRLQYAFKKESRGDQELSGVAWLCDAVPFGHADLARRGNSFACRLDFLVAARRS